MNAMPLIRWPCRFFSPLLQVLLLTIPGFSFSVAAHVGIHDEIETLSHVIGKDPKNTQLYLSRGEAYRLHGNRGGAIADFSTALAIDQDNVTARTGLGRTFLDQGDPGQAIVHLNRALTREPGNVRALSLRARANAEAGYPLKAAADYTAAIEQFDKQGKPLPGYYLERARALAAAGDEHIDSALQGLEEGVTDLGNIRTLKLYAVELEVSRGNFDAALARMDEVLAGAQRKEFLLLQRGDILAAAGRTAAALQDYLAAQVAIDALPPQRRHTHSVRQLQAQLDVQLASYGHRQ